MLTLYRYLRKLKNNVRNKAKVEGSIYNAYLVEEASTFCSYYFEDHVKTKQRNMPRNVDGCGPTMEGNISIFMYPGRAFGSSKMRYLKGDEFQAARAYILRNCTEVEPYIE